METDATLSTQRSDSVATLVEPHSSTPKNIHELSREDLIVALESVEKDVTRLEFENSDLKDELEEARRKEKELEQNLETLSALIVSNGSHQKNVDMQQMYDQLIYKDKRIVDLNNQLLDKERQIIELQEFIHDQGEVSQAKNRAVQIVNKRLQEIDGRRVKDASTETDFAVTERSPRNHRSKPRVNSPGRAIPQLRLSTGNGSPPPLDPAEDVSSFTTETATYDEPDRDWSPSPTANSALNRLARKYRKRVTFDLHPNKKPSTTERSTKQRSVSPDPARLPLQGIDGEVAQQIIDLTNENDELRRIISEIERAPLPEQQMKIDQLEEEIENIKRNGKNQVLRARAAAQARIKELEGRIVSLQSNQAVEVASLNATNEALKASREFILEENGKLSEQIEKLQQKESDLRSELAGAVDLSLTYRRELDNELRRVHELRIELKNSHHETQLAIDEKQLSFNEIDRLKEAIVAQDELIKVLEGDLIVYETRVGLLRDSLGASKIEDRQAVRTKAVSAKVNALEVEKQDILKKRNEDKLRTKALHVKIRCLEQERDDLLRRLQQLPEPVNPSPRSAGESLSAFVIHSNGQAIPASSLSSVISESSTLVSEQNSTPNNTMRDTNGQIVAELQQKLEQMTADNAKLQTELETMRSTTSTQNILGLLHAVEDIAHDQPMKFPTTETSEIMPATVNIEVQQLEAENGELKQENSSLQQNLAELRDHVMELQAVVQKAERVKLSLTNEKEALEMECRRLKQLVTDRENELAAAQAQGEISASSATEWQTEIARMREENSALVGAKDELQRNVATIEKSLEQVKAEKAELEQKLSTVQEDNQSLTASHERLTRFETENNRLDQLVSKLRNEIEQFQIEAELSRTCLDDLRRTVAHASSHNSVNAGSVNRVPSVDDAAVMRTALEALAVSQQAVPDGNATDYYPTNNQSVVANEVQQAAYVAPTYEQAQPVFADAAAAHNQIAYQPPQPQPQQQPQQQTDGPSPSAPPISQMLDVQAYYYQERPDAAQPVAAVVNQNAVTATSSDFGAENRAHLEELTRLRNDYAQLQSAYQQALAYYEQRERDLVVQKEQLEQQTSSLTEQLNEAQRRTEDVAKESGERENEVLKANERATTLANAKQELEVQLEEHRNKLCATEQELSHLRNQMERMDNESNQLRDTNTRLEHFITEARTSLSEAEATRNTLASENRELRCEVTTMERTLEEMRSSHAAQTRFDQTVKDQYERTNAELREQCTLLQEQLQSATITVNDHTESVVNATLAAVDSDFDANHVPSNDAEVQCRLLTESSPTTTTGSLINSNDGDAVGLSAVLQDYVEESNKFNDNISEEVRSLYTLNNELASAADCLKGQVWALNEQLKKSFAERQDILGEVERLEACNSSTTQENERLKLELVQQQTQLRDLEEQNARWTHELGVLYEKKADVDQAYQQLSDKYAQLQDAYDALLARISVPKNDGATDPLVQSDFIDAAAEVQVKYVNLERISEQMRAELEASSEKIRRLEQQFSFRDSTTAVAQALVSEASANADENARGVKESAHWTMVEIKKLLIDAAETLQRLPIDAAYDFVKQETEVRCAERVRHAIVFCENVMAEMQRCEDERAPCDATFAVPEDSDADGIERVILRLHERWRAKHHELLESATFLQTQQQLCQELELRLSDAQEKLAELESRRASESSADESLTPSMQEFWKRIVESFSQSCRATAAMDLRLNSTNGLIKNALQQLDSSSCNANSAMVSAKLQFAILAARLTAKQADNDALFRATAELAHTNVALQNQLDELQEQVSVYPLSPNHDNAVSPEEVEAREEVCRPEMALHVTGTVMEAPAAVAVEACVHVAAPSSILVETEPKSESDTQETFFSTCTGSAEPHQPAAADDWGWGAEEGEHADSAIDGYQQMEEENLIESISPEDLPSEPSVSGPPKLSDDVGATDWGWNTHHANDDEEEKEEVKGNDETAPTPPPTLAQPQLPSLSKVVPEVAVEEPTADEWDWKESATPKLPSPKTKSKPAKSLSPRPKAVSPKVSPVPSEPTKSFPASTADWGWGEEEATTTRQSAATVDPPTPAPTEWGWGEPETTTHDDNDDDSTAWAWKDDPEPLPPPTTLPAKPKKTKAKVSPSSATAKVAPSKKSETTKQQCASGKRTAEEWAWNDEEETEVQAATTVQESDDWDW